MHVFESHCGDDRDISEESVLREIVEEVGLDPKDYFEKIAESSCKNRIRENTDECMRGVMARGFARFRCECGHEILVAFSCCLERDTMKSSLSQACQ